MAKQVSDERQAEKKQKAEELEKAADLWNDLLSATDSQNGLVLGQFEASTLMLMLTDTTYRNRVRERFEKKYDTPNLD